MRVDLMDVRDCHDRFKSDEEQDSASDTVQSTSYSACFDRTHRVPADKTAALVVSTGERHDNAPQICNHHWESPPPTKQPPPDAPKIVGVRVGRLTVIGMHRDIKGRWVVRCDCGDYEVRRAKAILNPSNNGDRCVLCRNAAFQIRDYEYRVHGRELDRRTL